MANQTEMGNFTSARYDDLVLENVQNEWIEVSKEKKS
jgi:hypothetical protein